MTTYAIYPQGTSSFGTPAVTDVIAKYLATPGAPVFVASNAPVAGQVLIATSATNATWQNPATFTTINDLRIEGNVTNTATAVGTLAIAMGRNTYAGGTNSITLGPNTTTATNTSVVVGNACSTVSRSGADNGDSCVIVGSGCTISNAGGPSTGALYDTNISIGANNVTLYQAGNSRLCNANTVLGGSNALTIAHQANFRRNFFITGAHTVTTSGAHSATINDNIIIGRGGSYTSDGATAGNNVVIGTVPTWTGCNNSVVVGANVTAPVKNSVVLGADSTVPATDTCISIGYNNQHSGSFTNTTVVGTNVTVLGATDSVIIGPNTAASAMFSIVMGKSAISNGERCVAIGYLANADAFSQGSITIGQSATVSGIDSVSIGRAASCASGSAVVIGVSASSTFADNSVVVGKSASVTATGGVAIGQTAVVSAGNAAQIGTGTNSTANSLKFRGAQIHDGTTPSASQLVYKSTTAGNYKGGATFNLTVNEPAGTYQGVIAGRTTDPNNTQFSDYDSGFGRDSPSYAGENTLSSPSSANFVYRDGIHFMGGYPINTTSYHGWDNRWGPNTFWRYAQGLTDAINRDSIIPLVRVPKAHYCHMELTITAMRVANYIPGSNTFNTDHVVAGNYVWDSGLVGGRSWSGISAVMIMGDGTGKVCRVRNNWGGNASDSDESMALDSVSGVLNSLQIMRPLGQLGGPAGTVVSLGIGAISLGNTLNKAFKPNGNGRGFSRWDTGINAFGDYEIQGLSVVEDVADPNQRVVGIIVKGKEHHRTDWRVTARCTLVPFVDPAYPGP